MSVVYDILVNLAPEFINEEPKRVNTVIDLADVQVGHILTGTKRNLAVAYLTAHMLTIAKRRGSGGAIASESEGELSRSYAVAVNSGYITTSSYGQEFERLMGGCIFAARTRMVTDDS